MIRLSLQFISEGGIESRAEQGQMFSKKDINRIAKVAFQLVSFLHIRLHPQEGFQSGNSLSTEGEIDHAWECPECEWTKEMLD